jgi:hypothetical protein
MMYIIIVMCVISDRLKSTEAGPAHRAQTGGHDMSRTLPPGGERTTNERKVRLGQV